MNKKMAWAVFAVVVGATILTAGGILYQKLRQAKISSSGAAHDYTATISADTKSIEVTDHGASIKTITLAGIPSFDMNDEGNPANPLTDYLFGATTAIDASHATLYFSVYNSATAGNANVDHALFSYNIKSDKLTLLKNESYTISFGTLEPSPTGRFLVYSDGSDGGGLCRETIFLAVYDLQNQTDTPDFVTIPTDTVGVVEFDHWNGDVSFAYREETYPSMSACLKDLESNPHITERNYTITAR